MLVHSSCTITDIAHGNALHGQVHNGDYRNHLHNVAVVYRLLRQCETRISDIVRCFLALLAEPV